MLQVTTVPLGPLGTNCYVTHMEGSVDAVIIDPGGDAPVLEASLVEAGLEPRGILLTHCHWDHIGAVAPTAAQWIIPVWMSAIETPALEHPEQFAMPGTPISPAWTVDHQLDGDERVEIAGIAFEVLPVPGHSPGHLAFLHRSQTGAADTCFVGDVIFRGSVGRTDLPYSDPAALDASLALLVDRLRPETVLYSGHGPVTTLAEEIRSNPFLHSAAQAR